MRVFSLFAVALLCAFSSYSSEPTPKEIEVINLLKKTDFLLKETVQSDFAVRVSKFKTPQELIKVLDRAIEYLQENLPAESKVHNDIVVGRLYANTISLLIAGRGRERFQDHKNVWYLNNKEGHSGFDELMDVISRGKLDKTLKRGMIDIVKRIDPKNFKIMGEIPNKTSGFITASIVEDILEALEQSNVVPEYTNLYEGIHYDKKMKNGIETTRAVTKITNLPTKQEKEFKEKPYYKNAQRKKKTFEQILKEANFIDTLPANINFYKRSVEIYNSEGKKFPHPIGREDSLKRIVDILARPNKAHIVLTSKIGVDRGGVIQLLSDALINRTYVLADEMTPIVLEIDPLYLMAQGGPSKINTILNNLSSKTNRRVVAYFDESQVTPDVNKETMKSFLSESVLSSDDSKVQYIFSLTSADSRKFLDDASFASRMEEVYLKELDKDQSKQLIRENFEPMWKAHFKLGDLKFNQLEDEALEFAARNFKYENPNTVRSKAMSELFEGVIAHRRRVLRAEGYEGSFDISIDNIRDYFSDKFNQDLIPGSEKFNSAFERRWDDFQAVYGGNEGFKEELRELLYLHFSDPDKKQMTSTIVFGPPGAGKSYGAQKIADAYFDGAVLELNGADFKKPSDVNKITGSPPGYVGSEQQRSVFTKFIKENPNGGIILIEEADYIHPDIMELFTNMITSKEFRDALGKDYDVGKYVLWLNSNIGQEYMIPTDSKNKMDWFQFNVRLNQLTQEKKINGRVVPMVRSDKKMEMMNKFMAAVVNNGRVVGSANNEVDEKVSQAAQKQNRRYTPLYTMLPSKEELNQAAQMVFTSYKTKLSLDYNIELEVSEKTLEQIIDVENMEFEKGYSYVQERLDTFLFNKVNFHKSKQGAKISVELKQERAASPVDNKNLLELTIDNKLTKYDLGNMLPAFENQWAKSDEIKNNIKNLPKILSQYLMGDEEIILDIQSQLKRHVVDWNSRPTITLLGTTGNGKTQAAKATAKAVFGSSTAYKILPTTDVEEFNSFLKGQEFKNWIESRIRSGGGVIVLDELLSIQQNPQAKLYMFNKLYSFLDEGYMTIQGKEYDLRAFIPFITGNAMQEFFQGVPDNPDGEQLVKRIIEKTSKKDIVQYFQNFGFDAPKIARMGLIRLKGPLEKAVAYKIGNFLLQDSFESILHGSGIYVDFTVEPKAIEQIVDNFSTILLGMRDVKEEALNKLILNPIASIIIDMPQVKKVKLGLDKEGKFIWYADERRIILQNEQVTEKLNQQNWVFLSEAKKEGNTKDFTLQLENVKPKRREMTRAMKETTRIHEVEGHWMVDYLLNGKNGAESINLIPGEGYLGYMRPKPKAQIDVSTLYTEMKNVIMLEAGHRAVFQRGTFEYGGGSSGRQRDPKSSASDDLGRVEEAFNRILSQNIFEDYVEFSKPANVFLFKDTLRMIGKYSADYVIAYGNEIGVSEGINSEFTKKIQRGEQEFLNEEEIELFVKEFQQKHKMKNHEELFYEAIIFAIEKYMDREDFADEAALKKLKLLKDFASSLSVEIRTTTRRLNTASAVYENHKRLEEKLLKSRAKFLQNSECNNHFK